MSSSLGTTNSGSKANKTGNLLEKNVENVFRSENFELFVGDKKHAFDNRQKIGGKKYIKQLCVGDTIYNTPRTVDFFAVNETNYKDGIIIECKWQQTAGSVDEKYPYLVENILKTNIPTIILLDGNGYKAGARDWLVDQVNIDGHEALIGVWSLMQFITEVNNGFLD